MLRYQRHLNVFAVATVVVATGIGLLFTAQALLVAYLQGIPLDPGRALVSQVIPWFMWVLLIPGIFFVAHVTGVQHRSVPAMILLHLASGIAFVLLHIVLTGVVEWTLGMMREQPLSEVLAQLVVNRTVTELFSYGMIATMYHVLVYVDELKHAELTLRTTQLQRLDAIGRLAGGVAHDLNNLLTVINAHTDHLARELPKDGLLRTEVEGVRRSSERAAALTQQLLAFGRGLTLRPRPVDLNRLAHESATAARRLLPPSVVIQTRLDPAATNVHADRGKLEQVLLNLIINARDALPRGGTIVLHTGSRRLDAHDGDSHGVAVRPGEYGLLSVTDDGIGMDADTRARVFEPFFTTKPPGSGSGLGLATAYGIVKQSGGYIFLHSEPERGSTFNIYLPATHEREHEETAEEREPDPGGTRPAVIMLAEDEEPLRNLCVRVLQRAGHHVLCAADGPEAMRIVAESGRHVDLLITDVQMPGMNGVELARRLALLYPELRTLLVSGYAEWDARATSADLPLLAKPFTPGELVRKVNEVLGTINVNAEGS